MRLKISNLNYLQREIMLMHYIDELPIKIISKKLNITESTVKWHLFDTRKKLKKEINEMNKTDFVYRPGKLHMAISGNPGPAPDTQKINESLTKQNICLACYKESKTADELSEMLGIAKAYIEFDLKWLVEKQFMKNENGKYSTIFSIRDGNYYYTILNLFIKNKEKFSDVIIDKFISRQDKIKDINFYGSSQPIEKLLWLLIYKFIKFIDYKVTYEENKYPQPERPIMPDGGQYFPLGFSWLHSERTVELLNEKYRKISNWDTNGAMENDGSKDGFKFHWMGLYTAGGHTIGEKLYPSIGLIKKVLCKTLSKDFNIDDLNDDEKETLSEIIKYGWVSKKDDKIIHNFSIFTREQNEALGNIFAEIYEEMKDEIYKIFVEIQKLCRANLPKHLDFYTNYHIYMSFYSAIEITTGFAYYDGKLYDPKDDVECGLLTLQVITG
jgi:DNA-binding CsgD family transcriptional regulator